MEQHVKILGILHIVMSGLCVLVGLAVLLLFGGLAGAVAHDQSSPDNAAAIPILGGIGLLIFVVLVVIALPGLIAGIGLLKFRPWARILAIVLSAIHLLNIPIGTALGVYGLWALCSPEGEALFKQPPAVPVQPY